MSHRRPSVKMLEFQKKFQQSLILYILVNPTKKNSIFESFEKQPQNLNPSKNLMPI